MVPAYGYARERMHRSCRCQLYLNLDLAEIRFDEVALCQAAWTKHKRSVVFRGCDVRAVIPVIHRRARCQHGGMQQWHALHQPDRQKAPQHDADKAA